jgi:hypothetical protein
LDEWLQLDAKNRKGKTPFITTDGDDGEQRQAVSMELATATGECLAIWRTLQELAGIVTPFTARLEQEIRASLSAEHQADLDAQKKASDEEIRAIQEKTQTEIASKIRSRLLQLASQKRD